MRTYLPAFELRRVKDLDEALRVLSAEPGIWRPFAGGTDLMVLMESGTLSHTRYLSLWGLPGLRGIDVTAAAVTLGALTTYSDILRHPVLQSEFPMVCQAAAETGGVATQNRGTIGGNIGNASPAADMPPALLVYDAELEVASVRGIRRLAYARFHSAYKVMDLAGDELITAVRLPRVKRGWIETYRKVGTRRAQAISKVCVAAALDVRDAVVQDARFALGSVAPTVVRCLHAEASVRGRRIDDGLAEAVRAAVVRDIAPIDDARSTARYRARVAQNVLAEFVLSARR